MKESNHLVTSPLVWLDLEMTGLDPEKHVILEVACVITDSTLKQIIRGPHLIINYDEGILSGCDEWSRDHHTRSGLLDKVRSSQITLKYAEEILLDFVNKYCEKSKSPLCGNSIWQDRRFLIKHMPRLEEFFHYRNIDVSSIKELVTRWYPNIPKFNKKKTHSAIEDVLESISELIYYRNTVFLPLQTMEA